MKRVKKNLYPVVIRVIFFQCNWLMARLDEDEPIGSQTGANRP